MVQAATSHTERIEMVLAMNGSESGALASLLYDIATGRHNIVMAPNQREALMQMYADAYQFGHRVDKPMESR